MKVAGGGIYCPALVEFQALASAASVKINHESAASLQSFGGLLLRRDLRETTPAIGKCIPACGEGADKYETTKKMSLLGFRPEETAQKKTTYFFLPAADFEAAADFFFAAEALDLEAFWPDFFWFDLGDLSPITLFFILVGWPAAFMFRRRFAASCLLPLHL